jgi:pyruvate kinase
MAVAAVTVEARTGLRRAPQVLYGVGVSSGVARGPARRVADEADARAVKPGEVVVVGYLPAQWVPLLRPAAAVVDGTGSLLCSAATVLREMRIPAVMAVGPVLATIDAGRQLTVNGWDGTVHAAADLPR